MKNLSQTTLLRTIYVLLITVLNILPSITYAQSTMTGGVYTLNGGLTVFNANASSSAYSFAESGDPITGQNAVQGVYTLSPSPFTNIQSSANQNQSGQSTSGGITAGYVQNIQFHTDGLSDVGAGIEKGMKGKMLKTTDIYEGTSWFDTGSSSDGFHATFTPSFSDINKKDDLISEYQFPITKPEYKYSILTIFFLCMFARVFRATGATGVYVYSRYPAAILVDSIIHVHKGHSLSQVVFRAGTTSKLVGYLGIFVGAGILCICALVAIFVYKISHILSLIFCIIIIFRVYMYYILVRNLS